MYSNYHGVTEQIIKVLFNITCLYHFLNKYNNYLLQVENFKNNVKWNEFLIIFTSLYTF